MIDIDKCEYYQWDSKVSLTIPEMYKDYIFLFQNSQDQATYVVMPEINNDQYIVYIPDICLQKAGYLYLYYCESVEIPIRDNSLKTIAKQTFTIVARGKPIDYIYSSDPYNYSIYPKVREIEEQVDINTADIEQTDETLDNHEIRITNIEKHINSDYFVTDEATAYIKTIPVDTCPYAQLNNLGGMTYKCNNLIPFPYAGNKGIGYTVTKDGITYTVLEDGRIKANGTATKTTTLDLTPNVFMLPKGIYSISGGIDTNAFIILSASLNDSWIAESYAMGNPEKFNLSTREYDNNKFYLYIKSGTTLNNAVFAPMINYGETALPYETRYEGLRDSKITMITNRGANLFDKNNPNSLIAGFYSGSYIYNQLSTTIYIPCEPNTTYTISKQGNITNSFLRLGTTAELPAVGIPIIDFNAGNDSVTSLTLTTSREAKYLLAMITNSSFGSGDIQAVYDSIQINVGSAALPYTPYHEPITYDIPEAIQNLDGWGKGVEGYANFYDFENKKYIKNCKTIVLNGTEAWSLYASASNHFQITVNDNKFGADLNPIICSEYITHKEQGSQYSNLPRAVMSVDGGIIRIKDDRFDTVDSFKAYVAELYAKGTPITITYALANPIEIDITTDFDNIINVEGGGSLEFVNEYKNAAPSSITYLIKEGSI